VTISGSPTVPGTYQLIVHAGSNVTPISSSTMTYAFVVDYGGIVKALAQAALAIAVLVEEEVAAGGWWNWRLLLRTAGHNLNDRSCSRASTRIRSHCSKA